MDWNLIQKYLYWWDGLSSSLTAGCWLKLVGHHCNCHIEFLFHPAQQLDVDWNVVGESGDSAFPALSSSLTVGCGLKHRMFCKTKKCGISFIQLNNWMWIETCGLLVGLLGVNFSYNFIVECGLKRSLAWKVLRHRLVVSFSFKTGCGLKPKTRTTPS